MVIGTLGALVWVDAVAMPVLFVVAFALGIGETLFDTAAQSMMPSVVDRDQLSRANGRLYAVELSMNQFVGPPLGGVIAGIAIAWAFVGSGVAYLFASAALVLLRGSFRPTRDSAPIGARSVVAVSAVAATLLVLPILRLSDTTIEAAESGWAHTSLPG